MISRQEVTHYTRTTGVTGERARRSFLLMPFVVDTMFSPCRRGKPSSNRSEVQPDALFAVPDGSIRAARIDQTFGIGNRGSPRVTCIFERSFDRKPENAAASGGYSVLCLLYTYGGIEALVVVMCKSGLRSLMRKDQRVKFQPSV